MPSLSQLDEFSGNEQELREQALAERPSGGRQPVVKDPSEHASAAQLWRLNELALVGEALVRCGGERVLKGPASELLSEAKAQGLW